MVDQPRNGVRNVGNIQGANSQVIGDQQNVVVQQPNGNLQAIAPNNSLHGVQSERVKFRPAANKSPQLVVNNRDYHLVNNELSKKLNPGAQNAQGAIQTQERQSNLHNSNVQERQSNYNRLSQQYVTANNRPGRPSIRQVVNVKNTKDVKPIGRANKTVKEGLGPTRGPVKPAPNQTNQAWWESHQQAPARGVEQARVPLMRAAQVGQQTGHLGEARRMEQDRQPNPAKGNQKSTNRRELEHVPGLLPGQPLQPMVRARRLLFEKDLEGKFQLPCHLL